MVVVHHNAQPLMMKMMSSSLHLTWLITVPNLCPVEGLVGIGPDPQPG